VSQQKREYPMHCSPRCGAKTRSGRACCSPAMRNGRCRMHGGRSLRGEASPNYRHGGYTREVAELRRQITRFLSESKKTLETL